MNWRYCEKIIIKRRARSKHYGKALKNFSQTRQLFFSNFSPSYVFFSSFFSLFSTNFYIHHFSNGSLFYRVCGGFAFVFFFFRFFFLSFLYSTMPTRIVFRNFFLNNNCLFIIACVWALDAKLSWHLFSTVVGFFFSHQKVIFSCSPVWKNKKFEVIDGKKIMIVNRNTIVPIWFRNNEKKKTIAQFAYAVISKKSNFEFFSFTVYIQ